MPHHINQPMLLRNSARPDPRTEKIQGLWFALALKWVAQYSFYYLENTFRRPTVGLNPIAEILSELGLEYGLSLLSLQRYLGMTSLQGRPHREVHQWFVMFRYALELFQLLKRRPILFLKDEKSTIPKRGIARRITMFTGRIRLIMPASRPKRMKFAKTGCSAHLTRYQRNMLTNANEYTWVIAGSLYA